MKQTIKKIAFTVCCGLVSYFYVTFAWEAIFGADKLKAGESAMFFQIKEAKPVVLDVKITYVFNKEAIEKFLKLSKAEKMFPRERVILVPSPERLPSAKAKPFKTGTRDLGLILDWIGLGVALLVSGIIIGRKVFSEDNEYCVCEDTCTETEDD